MTYKMRKALLQKINPAACSDPIFKDLDAHQERMANDPAIRQRRAESWKAMLRSMAPALVLGFIFNSVLWAASVGIAGAGFAFTGWAITCLIVAAAFRP